MGLTPYRTLGLGILLLLLGPAAAGALPERKTENLMLHQAHVRTTPPRLAARGQMNHTRCVMTLANSGALFFYNADLSSQPSGVFECGTLISWQNVKGRIFRLGELLVEGKLDPHSVLTDLQVKAGFALNNATTIPITHHSEGALWGDPYAGYIYYTTSMIMDDAKNGEVCVKEDTDTLSMFLQISMRWKEDVNATGPDIIGESPLKLMFTGSAYVQC